MTIVKGKCPNKKCHGDLMLNYKGRSNQVKCISCSGWFTITPALYNEWSKEAKANGSTARSLAVEEAQS